MQRKGILGRIALTTVSLLPVVWRALFQDQSVVQDYASVTYTIGMVTGLISYTMLALTFVLATRWKWIENLFGGLDKMYIVHAVVGSGAFLFMLAHPIFLVLKYLPTNTYLAAIYLLPGSHRSINFGVGSFLFMIVLMGITLFIKRVKYHHWKASHTFFSLAFLFVAVHVFMIKGDLARIYFPYYYTYARAVGLMGLLSYSYTLGKSRLQSEKFFTYTIVGLHRYDTATECICAPVSKHIQHEAGQFAFVQFDNPAISSESHPFSFASYNPKDTKFRMIIKHSGDYTKTVHNLKLGDTMVVEGPYGTFTLDTKDKKHIWIAGGIGITPFISMAAKVFFHPDIQVDLYYLVRETTDLIGLHYLEEIAQKTPGFRIIPWVSSQKGRFSLADIEHLSGNLGEYVYYLCGPEEMKNSITTGLQEYGIAEKNIHTEGYTFKI